MFVSTVTFFYLLKTIVSAHELSSDGSISAVLHIEPTDDPVEFIPQQFELTFKDSSNRLDLNVCDCKINLSKDNQIINLKLNPKSNLVSLNNYTFNVSGNYQLSVSGKPKVSGTFQSFSLNYDVSVKNKSKNSRVLLVTGIVTTQIFIALGLYRVFTRKKY